MCRKLRPGMIAAIGVLIAGGFAHARTITGEWTLGRARESGKVRFSLESSWQGGSFSNISDWNASELKGIDWSSAGKHDVRFTIAREAGNIDCEGFLKDGEGAGMFTFRPNPQYASQMAAAGFPGVTDEEQFSFALQDVSLSFAREMKAAGIEGLDKSKLIAFRIQGVTPEYVRDLEQLGYPHPPANKLIALRIQEVTPEYIRSLRAHGLHDLTLDQLIALRVQGIN